MHIHFVQIWNSIPHLHEMDNHTTLRPQTGLIWMLHSIPESGSNMSQDRTDSQRNLSERTRTEGEGETSRLLRKNG